MLPEHAGQSLAGDHSDFGTDELYCCHQRKSDQSGPQGREAEGCTCHRISADSRRIVIRSSRDKARSNPLNRATERPVPVFASHLLRTPHSVSLWLQWPGLMTELHQLHADGIANEFGYCWDAKYAHGFIFVPFRGSCGYSQKSSNFFHRVSL